ncbi:MAG: transporter substrate-binding domain-containing protein, partial [Planctomycetota bacterium]
MKPKRTNPHASPFRRALLLALPAVLVIGFAVAPESRAEEAEDSKIASVRVGIYHYPPLLFVDKGGKASGFYVDIVDEVARLESWSVEYVFGTWDECLARLEGREIDLLLSIAYTEERAKKYAYINETVFTNWGQVYVHRSREVRSIFDLKGLRVAVLSNDVYSYGPHGFIQIARKLDMDYELNVEAQYDGVIAAVQEGRADAGITSRGYRVDLEANDEVRLSPVVMSPVEIRFALPKDGPLTPGLIKVLDRHISRLKKDPDSVYHRSIEKHVGAQTRVAFIPRWIWAPLAVGGALLLFFVLSHFVLQWQVQKKTRELRASEDRYRTLV